MKIGVDCRLSGTSHAGIGRYVENLIRRLPALAPEIEWVYFYHDQAQIDPELKVKNVLAPIRHYTLAEQTQLVSIFNQQSLDLLHVPHFNSPFIYPKKLVVTIHDLLWHEQRGTQVTTLKSWQYWGKYLGYKLVASRAVNQATNIIVPTETTRNTLLDFYPHVEDKVVVTHEGVDDRLTKFKGKVKRKPKQLIYVGSLYPHKNLKVVISALRELKDWRLTVVGSRTAFQDRTREEVRRAGVESQVEFVGYLSDEELAKAIQRSTALVQPSLSEGFGLTGIEAMALGTPVIASDIPVFKEIYQNAATFFDPRSADDFVTTATKLKLTTALKKQMKAVVGQYSWDHMAEQTLVVYRQAYGA